MEGPRQEQALILDESNSRNVHEWTAAILPPPRRLCDRCHLCFFTKKKKWNPENIPIEEMTIFAVDSRFQRNFANKALSYLMQACNTTACISTI